MSIPMDLPPKEPVAIVMVVSSDVVCSGSNYGWLLDYPTPRNVSPEKRAVMKQQEGERRARASWGRSCHQSKGVRRGREVGRQERGFGSGRQKANAFERKRKALLAGIR